MLTAAHVIADSSAPTVEVRLAPGVEYTAVVVWNGAADGLDAALLEITDPGWLSRPLMPVRWGALIGSEPGVAVQAVGYPEAERRSAGRDTLQAVGSVNPGTGLVSRRYEVDISGPRLAVDGDGSPWSGTSGAALWSGGALVGVVLQDRGETFSNGRISALPVAELVADPGFREVVAPALEPAELVSMLAPPITHQDPPTPAFLLRADMEVLPFVGRRDELKTLTRWCTADESPVALLVGSGGQGKTRLARQFVASMRERGWAAGYFADTAEQHNRPHERLSVLAGATRPVLLVVDYAETAPTLISTMLQQAVSCRALRVLLLARSAGEWWRNICSSSPAVEMTTASAPIYELTELAGDVEARMVIYRRSVVELADRLPGLRSYGGIDWVSVASGLPDPAPDALHDGLALHLLMAALSSLLEAAMPAMSATEKRSGGPSGDHVMDVLLVHERRYWSRVASASRFELPDDLQEQAVAAATLYGAADQAEGRRLALRIPYVDGEARAARNVSNLLSNLYAGQAFWRPLEPDLLGEYLVAKVLKEMPEFVSETLPALSPSQAERAVTVISRIASRRTGELAGLAEYCVVLAEKASVEARRQLDDGDVPDLERLRVTGREMLDVAARGPANDSVRSRARECDRRIYEVVGDGYLARAEREPDPALRIFNLGMGCIDFGAANDPRRRRGYVEASIRQIEQLAGQSETAQSFASVYLPIMWRMVAADCRALGQAEEGLAAVDKAVDAVLNPFVAPGMAGFMSEAGAMLTEVYAMDMLVDRWHLLFDLGRLSEAVAVAADELAFRKVNIADEGGYAALLDSLNRYALTALDCGDDEAALEAVRDVDRLVTAPPAGFAFGIDALMLGIVLTTGRSEDGTVTWEELRVRLGQIGPVTPVLIRILRWLSEQLELVGRLEAAMQSFIFTVLADENIPEKWTVVTDLYTQAQEAHDAGDVLGAETLTLFAEKLEAAVGFYDDPSGHAAGMDASTPE